MKRFDREIMSVLMTYRRNRGRGFVSSNDFEKNAEMGFVSANNLQKMRGEGDWERKQWKITKEGELAGGKGEDDFFCQL